MRWEVVIGGWEHECCGAELERYQRVEWTCFTDGDGRLTETHHGLEELRTTDVHGTIVDLKLIKPDGSCVPVTRVPSGSSVRGFDEHDLGEVFEMYTDEVLDASTGEFVVTIESAH